MNERNSDGFTLLHLAALNGYEEVVKELLKAPGILVNRHDYLFSTPLHIAAKKGHYRVVKELLKDRRILVNKKDIYGYSPLDRV